MHSSVLFLSAAATLLDTASAHGFVTGVNVRGSWTKGADPVWFYNPNNRPQTAGWDSLNQDLGFVEPSQVGTTNVICHKSATPGKLYVNANPGDTVQFAWNTWPDSHKGPIINYIAPCNGMLHHRRGVCKLSNWQNGDYTGDCTTVNPSSLRWSKFSQSAIISPGNWVTDQMIKSNFTSSTTIPSRLAPGNYVIRHEIIALHGGQNDNG
jgi:lytic cellulose monooxygenase (C1-hydroxylating)